VQETFVTYQVVAFAVTIALGMFIGLAYDVLRVIRGTFRPSRRALFFYDLFFWILITVITFIVLLSSSWGEVRAYVFIGLGFGAVIYAIVLSKPCYRLLQRIMLYMCLIVRTIIRPFVWITKRVLVVWSFCKRLFRGFLRRIRKGSHKIKAIFYRKKKE
jgi:spore cortex biosynthesis protein YabQ